MEANNFFPVIEAHHYHHHYLRIYTAPIAKQTYVHHGSYSPYIKTFTFSVSFFKHKNCIVLVMVALCNRADHYIFALWFLLLSFFFFISSPNLSRHRLDVYHTSTHGVALVRILAAGLKHAACGLLKIQNAKKVAKNRRLGTIAQFCRAISSQLRHISTIGKKIFKQQYLPYMSPQYGELRPTSG